MLQHKNFTHHAFYFEDIFLLSFQVNGTLTKEEIMRKHLLAIILLLSTPYRVFPQLSIQMDSASAVITFDNTIPGVNIATYTADAPPNPMPAAGELDAAAWSFQGVGPSNQAKGTSMGGENEGGVYAFVVQDTNMQDDVFLGVQPTDTILNPGSINLTVLNSTGFPINFFHFSFERWILNDQDRGNKMSVLAGTHEDSLRIVPWNDDPQ